MTDTRNDNAIVWSVLSEIDFTKLVCVDIEAEGLDRHRHEINLFQIGYFHKKNGELKLEYFIWQNLADSVQKALVRALTKAKLLTHNGKFDFLFLFVKTGITLPLWNDTLVMAHVTGHDKLSLKALTEKYFGVTYDIDKESKTGKVTPKLIKYGLQDIEFTMKLYQVLRRLIKKYGVEYTYHHELRAYKAFYEAEKTGVPISPRRYEIAKELQSQYKPLEEELKAFAGINWGSTKQLGLLMFSPEGAEIRESPKRTVFWEVSRKEDGKKLNKTFKTKKSATEYITERYGKPFVKQVDIVKQEEVVSRLLGRGMGLEVIERTDKGEPATGASVLAHYSYIPIIKTLQEYRKLTKLETFIDSWEELQVDGRIYPSFNITARTGRTTCNNPNLQQVPQKGAVRNLIEAREGYTIISVDYSQAELRVASWFSGDENMQDAYNSGSDLHQSTLKLIYGDNVIDPEVDHDGAKRQRTNAKISNFSLVYGAVPQSLVNYAKGWGIDIPLKEAEELHKAFFKAYPKLNDFYERCKSFTRQHGYIESPIGRKRWLPDIYSSDWKKKSSAERQCINTPVQGMASDICISALADITFDKTLDHSKFTVLGSVHDAILIECKEEYAEELGKKVVEIMSNPSVLKDAGIKMPVPLKADLVIDKKWGD